MINLIRVFFGMSEIVCVRDVFKYFNFFLIMYVLIINKNIGEKVFLFFSMGGGVYFIVVYCG